jgi:N-acetyltransferase
MKPIFKYPPRTDMILVRKDLLEGHEIQLERLNLNHVPELTAAAEETDWDLLFDAALYRKWGLPGLVQELIRRDEEVETDLPYAVIHRTAKVAIGITRYLHIDKFNKKLEIATWYARDFYRTAVNTEAKFLLLRHAFESWKFIRVEFNIHKDNHISVSAIERIGANLDGTFPKNIILPDGTERTSVVYSITDELWRSKVKALLEGKLDAYPVPEEEAQATAKTIELLERLRKIQHGALEQTEKKLERLRAVVPQPS